MRVKHLLATIGLVLACVAFAPKTAQADGFVSPNVGASFGGDLDTSRLSYGVTFGWMGAGIIGVEFDFAYAPEFFEPEDDDLDLIDDSNLITANANLIVGAPLGGDEGQVRPYASGGVSVLRSHVTALEDLKVSNSDFGINAGAGIMAFFNESVGIRGDVRFYRSLADDEEDHEFDISFGDFSFWRAMLGVAFRFGA
jgi:hypothetical protein